MKWWAEGEEMSQMGPPARLHQSSRSSNWSFIKSAKRDPIPNANCSIAAHVANRGSRSDKAEDGEAGRDCQLVMRAYARRRHQQ